MHEESNDFLAQKNVGKKKWNSKKKETIHCYPTDESPILFHLLLFTYFLFLAFPSFFLPFLPLVFPQYPCLPSLTPFSFSSRF